MSWGIPRELREEHYKSVKTPRRLLEDPGTRWCGRCKTGKPVEEFGKNASQKSGFHGWCKDCINAYWREYRHANPLVPGSRRGEHFERSYGITQEQYNAMLEAQGGVCAICQCPPTGVGGRHGNTPLMLAVDHDHETGEVRGLLCGECNRALGHLKDDTELLRRAIWYLEKSKRQIA